MKKINQSNRKDSESSIASNSCLAFERSLSVDSDNFYSQKNQKFFIGNVKVKAFNTDDS